MKKFMDKPISYDDGRDGDAISQALRMATGGKVLTPAQKRAAEGAEAKKKAAARRDAEEAETRKKAAATRAAAEAARAKATPARAPAPAAKPAAKPAASVAKVASPAPKPAAKPAASAKPAAPAAKTATPAAKPAARPAPAASRPANTAPTKVAAKAPARPSNVDKPLGQSPAKTQAAAKPTAAKPAAKQAVAQQQRAADAQRGPTSIMRKGPAKTGAKQESMKKKDKDKDKPSDASDALLKYINDELGTDYTRETLPKDIYKKYKKKDIDTPKQTNDDPTAEENFDPNPDNTIEDSSDWGTDFTGDINPTKMKDFQKIAAGAFSNSIKQADYVKDRMLNLGRPDESQLTKDAYAQVAGIDEFGKDALGEAYDTSASLNDQYLAAKNYDKTSYNDIDQKAGQLGNWQAGDFSSSDYTTSDIQSRMNPYEELVAERKRQRLKRDYEEGRGQREMEAQRAGAFGGSQAAVKEMLDRDRYREALKDADAQSLYEAYQSGADLTKLADDSRNRAETAEEQSRQFGGELGIQALDRQQTARDATANETARAKEAEMAAIQGQGNAASQLAGIAQQQQGMELAAINAKNQLGQQEQQNRIEDQNYALDTIQKASDVYASGVSGTPVGSNKGSNPSTAANIMGYAATGASIFNSLGGMDTVGKIADGIGNLFRDGGYVAPKPSLTINLADGGIVDLHNAMFRRK